MADRKRNETETTGEEVTNTDSSEFDNSEQNPGAISGNLGGETTEGTEDGGMGETRTGDEEQ